jgi:hypothetical protein
LERDGVQLLAVVSRAEDLPDPAVVIVNPDDEVSPEAFRAWLDQLQSGEPLHLGVTAAQTLAEARAAGEV